jgi:hypothetical protein
MTISSIPPSLSALLASVRPAAPETTSGTTTGATTPKFTPAEDVENFVAQVEANTITELLGGGSDAAATGGLASLLGGASTGGSATDLASVLGGSTASPSTPDLTNLASIASAYDFAGRLASLGANPFDQSSWDANTTGSTLDTSA